MANVNYVGGIFRLLAWIFALPLHRAIFLVFLSILRRTLPYIVGILLKPVRYVNSV